MKRKVGIALFIVGFLLIILGLSPNIINNIDFKRLETEVNLINDCLKENKIEKIDVKELDKNITINNKDLEEEIENSLRNIINTITNILVINNNGEFNNALTIENIQKLDLNSIDNYLEKIKTKLNKLGDELSNFNNKSNNASYLKLINKVDIKSYQKMLQDNLNKVDNFQKILTFLKNNSHYKIENNNLIFLKRNTYENFLNLLLEMNSNNLNIFSYCLINDQTAPVINAYDLTIYKGSSIDLNSKFSCVDEVDGNIPCVIEGTYNKNKVGTYSIKITATDKSGLKSEKTIRIKIIEKAKLKYYMEIIRNHNIVIIYELDENNEYTKIAKVFTCSTGENGKTPTGIFYSKKGASWGSLIGGVWGQYYTIITGDILIHSVPYYTKSKDDLEWEEYNKLGSEASAGCVRLTVADAKWVFDNCPSGMKIKIYDGELPVGIKKPTTFKIDENNPFRGWDPTDPDINNPYNKKNND